MKQFLCRALGSKHYSMTDAIEPAFQGRISDGRMSINEALGRFDDLPVGESLVDEDGDVWTRVADLDSDFDTPDEPGPAAARQTERLERIATAALQGLLASSAGWTTRTGAAEEAVVHARNLIAELDKQP